MARTLTLGLALSLAACVSLPAPRTEGSPRGGSAGQQTSATLEAEVSPQGVTLREAGERPLFVSDRESLHAYRRGGREAITPAVEFTERSGGFDIEYTFTNRGARPMPLGALTFYGLELGRDFVWREMSKGGVATEMSGRGASERRHFSYGDQGVDSYSPVVVMETERHAVGISLLYPIMEYEHGLRGMIWGRSDGAWNLRWRLSNLGNEGRRARLRREAMLAPGETRSYTLAVRVAPRSRWTDTLEPYKEFFSETYGDVAYERDPRPVRGITLAGSGELSPRNPYGFRQEEYRPDEHGFGPLLDWVSENFMLGPRVMVWQPTGLYLTHRDANFPFKFTSFWLEGDTHGHQMGDALVEFPRFKARENIELGFWWGRASGVVRRWDSGRAEPLDPDDPEHVELAFHELDTAVRAGADFIGLDAFGSGDDPPLWDQVRWVKMMRERHPDVKFITERHKPDVLHRLGPTFFMAYNKTVSRPRSVDAMRYITTRHYLADYLLPGHETWLALRMDLLRAVRGFRVTPRFKQAEYERALGMGYVPVIYNPVDMSEHREAAETWEQPIPSSVSGPGASAEPRERARQRVLRPASDVETHRRATKKSPKRGKRKR